jgi:hypothetical protein
VPRRRSCYRWLPMVLVKKPKFWGSVLLFSYYNKTFETWSCLQIFVNKLGPQNAEICDGLSNATPLMAPWSRGSFRLSSAIRTVLGILIRYCSAKFQALKKTKKNHFTPSEYKDSFLP